METQNNFHKNLLIMVLPILPIAIFFLIMLGESILLFAVPLFAFSFMPIKLAKRLSTKDAISYPIIQYSFFILLFGFLFISPPGLEFILILPATFILNMCIGFFYFRYAKNKKWYSKVLTLLATFVITFVIYPPIITFSPLIEHGEFPFRVVYKIDGITYEIEDTIVVSYRGIQAGNRTWSSRLASGSRNSSRIDIFRDTNTPSAFTRGRINERIDIWLNLGTSTYYMGDRRGYRAKPGIMYSETYRMSSTGTGTNTVTREITRNQLLEHFGIEIITWSFSEPIRNQFRP